jgi:hypothetical protein
MIEQIVFSFLSAFILESPRVPWVSHFFKTFHKLVKLFRTMKTDGSYHTPCFFIEQLDDFFFHCTKPTHCLSIRHCKFIMTYHSSIIKIGQCNRIPVNVLVSVMPSIILIFLIMISPMLS